MVALRWFRLSALGLALWPALSSGTWNTTSSLYGTTNVSVCAASSSNAQDVGLHSQDSAQSHASSGLMTMAILNVSISTRTTSGINRTGATVDQTSELSRPLVLTPRSSGTAQIRTGNASFSIRPSRVSALTRPLNKPINMMLANITSKYSTNSTVATSMAYWNTSQASVTSTCPMTNYPSNYPIVMRTFADECAEGDAIYSGPGIDWAGGNTWYQYSDQCLAAWCYTAYSSTLFSFVYETTNQWPLTTYTTRLQDLYLTTVSTLTLGDPNYYYLAYGSLITTVITATQNWRDFIKPVSPCCAECYIGVQDLNLYFWKDQAIPAVSARLADGESTYVDGEGFTFVSPSVYLGLTSLVGTNACGPLGQIISKTTLAFNPDEISTLYTKPYDKNCTWSIGTVTLSAEYTYTIDARPLTYSDLVGNCTYPDGLNLVYNPDFPLNYILTGNPCYPYISIPDRIRNLDPAWRTCAPLFGGGFYDPPKTLQLGADLVPTTIASTTLSDPSMTATPPPSLPKIRGPTASPGQPTASETTLRTLEPPPQDPSKQFVNFGTGPLVTVTLNPNPPPTPTRPATESILTTAGSGSGISIPTGPHGLDPESNPPNGLAQSSQAHEILHSSPVPVSSRSEPESITLDSGNVLPSHVFSAPKVLLLGSTSFVADVSNRFTIQGKTLIPGGTITVGGISATLSDGRVTTVGGTQLILDPEGTQAVFGGSTTLALMQAPSIGSSQSEVVVKILDRLLTLLYDGSLVIGRKTIAPGSAATIGASSITLPDGRTLTTGGTTFSFDPIATRFIVDGTQTISLSEILATAVPHQRVVITVAGFVYTILDGNKLVEGTRTIQVGNYDILGGATSTLSDGQQTVVGGTTISLAPGGTAVVINGATTPITALQAQSTSIEIFAEVTTIIGTTAADTGAIASAAPSPTKPKHESGQSPNTAIRFQPRISVMLFPYLLFILV